MLIEKQIEELLKQKFNIYYLKITNESVLHHGSQGSETHFKIDLVSDDFINLKILQRHRHVQKILQNQIDKIKAFSLHALTYEEWQDRNQQFTRSPSCRGIDES